MEKWYKPTGILKAEGDLKSGIVNQKDVFKVAEYLKKNNYSTESYQMTDKEKEVRMLVMKHFALGDITMQKPRVELNDLSVFNRMQIDQMSFNTYQPNNGEPPTGDIINAWKSNAIRPIVRNKCISIAAHATARLLFPKVFAEDELSDDQQEAAQVMEDLMEWTGEQSNYSFYSLRRVLSALNDPASIGYTEYCQTYRKVKKVKENEKWVEADMLDEDLSGFQDTTVPVDQLYIENFYEPDIQKQSWLIWRRVISFDLAKAKYGNADNFKFVRAGVQLVYNDANNSFYGIYDSNMRQEDVEEIVYWNKALDLKIIMVNGVLMTPCDNPNPRQDKLYPFDKFGYELINNRCFYYKSLAFKMQQDANIINTLYPMIIDGTYLNLMPPMVNVGGEMITADVIVPGAVTTLADPNSDLRAIQTSNNLKAGMDTLFKVDESLNESSQEPIQQGQSAAGSQTAYEISRLEQNANTVLGLFIKMISDYVKQYGRLRLGDILQYLTIGDVDKITDNPKLVYKTFLMRNKQSGGSTKTRKIKLIQDLPESDDEETNLNESFNTLKEEGGEESKTELYKVNPEKFRDLKFMVAINPDVMNPRSEELENAYRLEAYDRAIQNPIIDQEEATRALLLGANPITKKDPDKFMMKKDALTQATQMAQGMQNPQQMPAAGNSPLAAMSNKLPQTQALKV